MKLVKAGIVEELYKCYQGYTKSEIILVINLFFETACKLLVCGEGFRIKNFGKFYIQDKKERMGCSPATGEKIMLPPMRRVAFKPSNNLRGFVNDGVVGLTPGTFRSKDLTDGMWEFIGDRKELPNLVDTIVTEIARTLISGGSVEIRGFGVLTIRHYGGYIGRNPKTGEKVQVPPKKRPFFMAGKKLTEDVRKYVS